MVLNALGAIEYTSVASGIISCDAMMKEAYVELLQANPICPGKYVAIIGANDVDAVRSSIYAGLEIGGSAVIDHLIIPNIHPKVFPAITATSGVTELKALGVIETFTLASTIIAADKAIKAADIELIEVRLAMGLAGKAFLTLTGLVADVEAAIKAGCESAKEAGNLINSVIIPRPHAAMSKVIL
jgi:microcompartment protein CcmL/EutN